MRKSRRNMRENGQEKSQVHEEKSEKIKNQRHFGMTGIGKRKPYVGEITSGRKSRVTTRSRNGVNCLIILHTQNKAFTARSSSVKKEDNKVENGGTQSTENNGRASTAGKHAGTMAAKPVCAKQLSTKSSYATYCCHARRENRSKYTTQFQCNIQREEKKSFKPMPKKTEVNSRKMDENRDEKALKVRKTEEGGVEKLKKNMLTKEKDRSNSAGQKQKIVNKEFPQFEDFKREKETQLEHPYKQRKYWIEIADQSECSSADATDQSQRFPPRVRAIRTDVNKRLPYKNRRSRQNAITESESFRYVTHLRLSKIYHPPNLRKRQLMRSMARTKQTERKPRQQTQP